MRPFLNWPGGKRWLVSNYQHYIKPGQGCHIEPFIGSGTVFFHFCPNDAIIADKNTRLTETYIAIKDDYEKVLSYLKIHDKNHCAEYYYKVRSRECRTPHTRAAQFIYLNRTCFNGIYRVNQKGKFNVPIGTKTHVLKDDDDFCQWALALQNASIYAHDFSKTISLADRGDFVYADPPYTVQHNNNSFVKYNEQMFSWEEQEKLCQCLEEANDRGARILISNADHESIWRLYNSDVWKIQKVERFSGLAASRNNRKQITEVLISNYFDELG